MPFSNNQIQTWYFNSKEGYILKKNKGNISLKNLHYSFQKKFQPQDKIIAKTYSYSSNPVQNSVDISMDYILGIEFRTYMFFNESGKWPNVIQKFVLSKNGRNQIFKCQWSPQFSVVEKVTNQNNFSDDKLPAIDRACTFEGPTHFSKHENVLSSATLDQIHQAVKQIEYHLLESTGNKLQRGSFYFKFDKNDQLVLLFATQIKIDKQTSVLLDSKEVKLKLANSQFEKKELYNSNQYNS